MPDWVPIVLSSAAVSALVGLLGNVLLTWWNARAYKKRKYEDVLTQLRVERCNQLLQHVNELCIHLSPVAKGTGPLERRGSGLGLAGGSSDTENKEIEQTLKLRLTIYSFVESNALYLGREVCLAAIYFDCGFDQMSFKLSLNEGKPSHAFNALCRWTWRFEDGIKDAIRRSLADATFTLPTSLDIGAARTRGHENMEELMAAVEKDPSSFSIDARNRELKQHSDSLRLPK